jgi:hypothetical protein
VVVDALHDVLAALDARVDRSALTWLHEQVAASDRVGTVALRTAIARCARLFDEAPLALEGLDAYAWTVRDGARAVLVLAALAARSADQHVALLDTLLRTGELGEQVSLLRMLPLAPAPERFVELAIETARTNTVAVFAAIATDNPYPARHFPAAALRQLVLKAMFVGLPVGRIVALAPRIDAELLRMIDDYADERRAAGRSIPEGVARIHQLAQERP